MTYEYQARNQTEADKLEPRLRHFVQGFLVYSPQLKLLREGLTFHLSGMLPQHKEHIEIWILGYRAGYGDGADLWEPKNQPSTRSF